MDEEPVFAVRAFIASFRCSDESATSSSGCGVSSATSAGVRHRQELRLRFPPRSEDAVLVVNDEETDPELEQNVTLHRNNGAHGSATFVAVDAVSFRGEVPFEVLSDKERWAYGTLRPTLAHLGGSSSSGTLGGGGSSSGSSDGDDDGEPRSPPSRNCPYALECPSVALLGGADRAGGAEMELSIIGCVDGSDFCLRQTTPLLKGRSAWRGSYRSSRAPALDAISEEERASTSSPSASAEALPLLVAGNGAPAGGAGGLGCGGALTHAGAIQLLNEDAAKYKRWPITAGVGDDTGEYGEMTWFSAGLRVGVGVGLGMVLGVGVGAGLMMNAYKRTNNAASAIREGVKHRLGF
mmetsp:Transcript_28461/g.92964  ORF Transcript_28461/g.92964 Transcript_28461/m.92964 type:complete len:352 (+) Transcript_28461:199-1254(+)|eukprot:CAMPEP_0170143272 /NCGR_PEP_ID=MMETSP0033_2-20121228/9869_1 /TAXON_ID=195969 /ORGANISM="Dolichomastix tenuilepis, Strain CCMP3274" /LENGTH=351 /DNA_ID=CAMNT_0010379707 /DNA_START=194 /DNA_END=1249 /DNA_ORIENTATION=+